MMAALAPAKAISAESPPSLPLLDRKKQRFGALGEQ
jgi:hypothetical protein